jgi:cytoskeleton protein RodZ
MSGLMEGSSAASLRAGPPATSAGFTEGAAFGEFLRHARERRGLTLQQIARETKIPQRHLDSLEHGDLSVIPGTTYRRGEVIAYADAVGLNRALALAELERVSRASAARDSGGAEKQQSPARAHRGVGPLASAVLFIAGIVGLVLWIQETRVTTNEDDATVQSAPSAPPPHARDLKEASPPPAIGSDGIAPAVRQEALEARPQTQTLSEETPAPTVDAESRLVIITEPAGARVTVDGIGWGTTPLSIRNLPAGTKQIRVTKDGYVAAVRVAQLTTGRPLTISIPLRSSEP